MSFSPAESSSPPSDLLCVWLSTPGGPWLAKATENSCAELIPIPEHQTGVLSLRPSAWITRCGVIRGRESCGQPLVQSTGSSSANTNEQCTAKDGELVTASP